MQTAEQILAATKMNLKCQQDFSASNLTSAKRDFLGKGQSEQSSDSKQKKSNFLLIYAMTNLKYPRQIEFAIFTVESQRDEARKKILQRVKHLEQCRVNGSSLVIYLVVGFPSSIKLLASELYLEQSKDAQNRWKEWSVLQQLKAQQNRAVLKELAVTNYGTKIRALPIYQQVELVLGGAMISLFFFLINLLELVD